MVEKEKVRYCSPVGPLPGIYGSLNADLKSSLIPCIGSGVSGSGYSGSQRGMGRSLPFSWLPRTGYTLIPALYTGSIAFRQFENCSSQDVPPLAHQPLIRSPGIRTRSQPSLTTPAAIASRTASLIPVLSTAFVLLSPRVSQSTANFHGSDATRLLTDRKNNDAKIAIRVNAAIISPILSFSGGILFQF